LTKAQTVAPSVDLSLEQAPNQPRISRPLGKRPPSQQATGGLAAAQNHYVQHAIHTLTLWHYAALRQPNGLAYSTTNNGQYRPLGKTKPVESE
jgi:hypothetical protein